jgi:hypothetical protein
MLNFFESFKAHNLSLFLLTPSYLKTLCFSCEASKRLVGAIPAFFHYKRLSQLDDDRKMASSRSRSQHARKVSIQCAADVYVFWERRTSLLDLKSSDGPVFVQGQYVVV